MRRSIIITAILFAISLTIILLAFGFEGNAVYEDSGNISYYPKEENLILDEDKTFISHSMNPEEPLLSSVALRQGKIVELDSSDDSLMDTSDVSFEASRGISVEHEAPSLLNENESPYKIYSVRVAEDVPKIENKIRLAESKSEKAPISLSTEKESIFRYEPLRLSILSDKRINKEDISVYIRRFDTKRLSQNGDNKYALNLVRKSSTEYETVYLHPFGFSVGTYEFVVCLGEDIKEVETKKFIVKSRPVDLVEKTMSVITMEYNQDIRSRSIPSVDGEGKSDYHAYYDWARYMKADSFWILSGQTTGWDRTLSKTKRWTKAPLVNTELLAQSENKKDIKLGAYIMSYYTPGYGNIKTGYDVAVGYNYEQDKLVSSHHISINCEERLHDIIELMKKFEAMDNVDYVGLDFIRTGERDGLEMVDEFVETTAMSTPASWNQMNTSERMKWLGRNRNVNYELNMKWRWFRAHKAAEIVKSIRDAGITKPLWVFTLGWDHGEEHGQDPYMFFDAGATIDAVMLYEASRAQYDNMMIQWPRYLRGNNNVFVGNQMDKRLLDGHENFQIEYINRFYEAVAKLNRNNRVRGLFYHDISRAFWSRNRGIDIHEWANINASIASRVREKYDEIDFSLFVEINEEDKSGVLSIVNKTDKPIYNIKIDTFASPAVSKLDSSKRSVEVLEPSGRVEIPFRYAYHSGKVYSLSMLSFRVKSENGEENVIVKYTNVEKNKSVVLNDGSDETL